jgi:hypothetical protein
MTRVILEGKKRRTPLLVMALMGVIAGVLIGGGGFSSAASTSPSVVDYSQCANGAPNKTPPNDPSTCNQGWINGILNANNSQYAENDATAQRFVVTIPKGDNGDNGVHNFTLKYLWNKANNHAYDSLVKWDQTISSSIGASGVCAGVPGTCPVTDANFNFGNGDSSYAIPQSACTDGTAGHGSVNGGSAGFGIASRDMVAYGGGVQITDISKPVNDSPTCSLSADEYETLKVSFTVSSLPATVMFLYGGHLACGTSRTGCWGSTTADTNGASNINGGPYHIKLLTIDGTSAGNQDNQIMSSAILPLTLAGILTTPGSSPTSSVSWTETLTDSATVTGNSPSGTVTFKLYTGGTCTNGVPDGTLIYTDPTNEPLNSSGVASTGTTDGYTVGNTGQTYGAGTYQWIATYNGDNNNAPATSTCGSEVQTVTAATTSGPSVQ